MKLGIHVLSEVFIKIFQNAENLTFGSEYFVSEQPILPLPTHSVVDPNTFQIFGQYSRTKEMM